MKRNSWFVVVVLVIVSLLPLIDLLHSGLPVTHDGQDHIARIANFYQSLTEGNIVPRWAENLNWGYGHPILMFLYPLPSYFASFFHVIGFSLVDSTKLVFAASFIASVLAMYLWLSKQWGPLPVLVGAALYGLSPYRFVDLYVRGALGEHVAFVFPPLILYGLLQIGRNKTRLAWWGVVTAVSVAGLILSHNAVSLMFLPLIVLYIAYLSIFEVRDTRRYLFLASLSIALGFALSAFFWIPAFFEGKYTLRDIVTKGEFGERFVPVSWFLYSPWNYGGGDQFSKQIGLSGWLGVVMAIVVWFKAKQKNMKWLLGGSMIMFGLSLFLMTNRSMAVWNTLSILQKFQFPWRFLTATVFLCAVLIAAAVSQLTDRVKTTVGAVVVLLSLISASTIWRAQSYVIRPESFYTGVYNGTTDTGESSPIWSVRFMEKRPDKPMDVIEGQAIVTAGYRCSTEHLYDVVAAAKTRLAENTLYFPGWSVLIDGTPTTIEFQDPAYRGLMTFWIEPGQHQVTIRFGNTRLRTFADRVSIIGLVFLAVIATIPVWKRKK